MQNFTPLIAIGSSVHWGCCWLKGGLIYSAALIGVVSVSLLGSVGASQPPLQTQQGHPNPYPSATVPIGEPEVWTFPEDAAAWRAVRDCTIETAPGGKSTVLISTGVDPILVRSVQKMQHPIEAVIELRTEQANSAQLFWDQSGKDRFNERDSARFELIGDGQWREYRVAIGQSGVRSLRFDPAMSAAKIEIRRITIQAFRPPTLEITQLSWESAESVRVRIRSLATDQLTVALSCQLPAANSEAVAQLAQPLTIDLPGLTEIEAKLHVPRVESAADVVRFTLTTQGYSCMRYCVRPGCLWDWEALSEKAWVADRWVEVADSRTAVRIARDGTAAMVLKREDEDSAWQLVACAAPLSWNGQSIQALQVQATSDRITAVADGTTVQFSLTTQGISFTRISASDIEGPVFRVPGAIEQALLAGVEHLGRGEASSSALDIETEDRFRYQPAPHFLTMQLAAVVTNQQGLGIHWQDPRTQPTFATPDFFDGHSGSRISWKGTKVEGMLLSGKGRDQGGCLEDFIKLYVDQRGLPPLPQPPRDTQAQDALNVSGFRRSELFQPNDGWFHAIMPGSHGMPGNGVWFGDHASALLALGQPLPCSPGQLAKGGSHILNDRWMFLLGRAEEWSAQQSKQLEGLLRRQQPDGAVVYEGPWSEGHFENTSSGQCGLVAQQLMTIAWETGNLQAREAGLKTLDYCKRFRTPRGAQVWECPLHAPDIMASAHLVKAYCLAWRMTGNPEYRSLAVRWALSGLPFLYLWQNSQENLAMPYASIATLCATHRVAPLWIGRPVQWCGIVYADALIDLSTIDNSMNWRQIAQGIYTSAVHQQYTSGPSIGLLPDSYAPLSDRRFPLDINPATMVLLGHRLANRIVCLDVAVIDGRHIVSPWPMRIESKVIHFECGESTDDFQIAVNGKVITRSPGLPLILP